jgi:hypothetical protein
MAIQETPGRDSGRKPGSGGDGGNRSIDPVPEPVTEGGAQMEKLELLQQFFTHGTERLQEEGAPDRGRSRKQTLRDRMQDPAVAEAVNLARSVMRDIPEVRKDLVASFKEQWKAGTLPQDGASLADRLLEDAMLNELL